jgi:outer membrane protein TolC
MPSELESDLANYAALERQLARVHQEWLPLAQQKVDLTTASYQAGKTDLTAVLTARRELIEQRFKLIELDNLRSMLPPISTSPMGNVQ